FPVHESHTLAGSRLGAIAGNVVDEAHRTTELRHGEENRHIDFYFRRARLIGTFIDPRQAIEIIGPEAFEEDFVELLVANEMGEAAGAEESDGLVAIPGRDGRIERLSEGD